MIAIMTVTGLDHTGIVAAVSTRLADLGVNIVNISQTLMGDFFTMILQVEVDAEALPLEELKKQLAATAAEQGLKIRVQSEAIFRAMHRV